MGPMKADEETNSFVHPTLDALVRLQGLWLSDNEDAVAFRSGAPGEIGKR